MAVESHRFGSHNLERESPHLFIYRLRGPLRAVELREMTSLQRQWMENIDYALILCDVRAQERTDPEARQVALNWNTSNVPRALAIVGASYPMRVLFDMLFRAIELLRRRPLHIAFHDDEIQAREWLAVMGTKFEGNTRSAA